VSNPASSTANPAVVSLGIENKTRRADPKANHSIGTGESSLPTQDWRRLVQATAEFITNIYSDAAESVECPLSILTEEVTEN
jgi:hypothetical protein